jgi:phage virion morphogenesis protein
MPGAQIKVDFSGLGSIAAGFRALQKLGHEPAPMLRAIGVALRIETAKRFENAQDPKGQPWKPWSRGYAAITESRSILRGKSGDGGLLGSLAIKVEGATVRLGSNKIYAGVHQFGATIVPVNKKALFFFIRGASGHVFGIHAKKVTIPARPYLGFGPADRTAVAEIVHRELRQALAVRRGG